MNKIVQIVTVPLKKDGYNKDDLIICLAGGRYSIATENTIITQSRWLQHQFLVLSNDAVLEGDWYKWGGLVSKRSHPNGIFDADYLDAKKIIASYPHIEGTLSISKETVQAWINADTPVDGRIEEGYAYYQGIKLKVIFKTNNGIDIRIPNKVSVNETDIEYKPRLTSRGNLILEFEKPKSAANEIYDIMKSSFDMDKNGKLSPKKTSIPTDSDVEEKATTYMHRKFNTWDDFGWGDAHSGYIDGYLQALKDLNITK